AGGRRSPSGTYGGSHKASFVIWRPSAAALRANTAPDEVPYTAADPPAAAITASTSSNSRSIAYGRDAPLTPRPRRSLLSRVKTAARAVASWAFAIRSVEPPQTRITGGPVPI